MPDTSRDRDPSPTPSQLPPVPGSPTYSLASTANPLSAFNLPLPPPPRPPHAVLSRADLDASQTAYADLLATAKSYRLALASLSTAASAFGSALESCARLKEARAEPLGPSPQSTANNIGGGLASPSSLGGPSPHPAISNSGNTYSGPGPGAPSSCTADPLLSASGVHQLVANHHHILSETVYRSFEVPLLHELDGWRQAVDDEEETYARSARDRGAEIRRLEKEGLKLHRQRGKRRDVGAFRAHLVELTNKLDGLTSLHGEHARALLRESQDTSGKIVDASCSLVRAEVDIFESLARKGWSGGGLEDLLERGTDLFASEGLDYHGIGAHGTGVGAGAGLGVSSTGMGPAEAAKLFSILPPRSILADATAAAAGTDAANASIAAGAGAATRSSGHARSDSLLVDDAERYQSLVGATVGNDAETYAEADADPSAETESVLSGAETTSRPRGPRPFSPQPIRRCPEDVTHDDSLGLRLAEGGDERDERDQQGYHEKDGSEKDQDTIVGSSDAAVTERHTDDEAQVWAETGGMSDRNQSSREMASGNGSEPHEEDEDADAYGQRGRLRRWSVSDEDAKSG